MVPAVLLACSSPVVGAVLCPAAEVLAAAETGQIFELVDGIDFSKPLDGQGFNRIMTSSSSALLEGDIIVAGARHYGWIGDGRVVDLDTKAEGIYGFDQEDAFYRFKKLDPVYEVPVNLTAVYHDELQSVILPDGFSWTDTGKIEQVGEAVYKAMYTPANTLKYHTVEDIPVMVMVGKKTVSPSMPDNAYTVQYKAGLKLGDVKLPDGWSFAEPGSGLSVGEGMYQAVFQGDTEHYEYDVTQKDVTVRVEKGFLPHPSLTYIRVPAGTYLSDDLLPNTADGSYSWDSSVIVNKSGSYGVTFHPSDKVSYNDEPGLKIYVYVSSALKVQKPSGSNGNRGNTSHTGSTGNAGGVKTPVQTAPRAPSTSGTLKSEPVQTEKGSTRIRQNTSGSYLTAKTLAATNKSSSDMVVKKDDAVKVTRKTRPNASSAARGGANYEKLEDEDGKEYYHLFEPVLGAFYFRYDDALRKYLSCNADGTEITENRVEIERAEFESFLKDASQTAARAGTDKEDADETNEASGKETAGQEDRVRETEAEREKTGIPLIIKLLAVVAAAAVAIFVGKERFQTAEEPETGENDPL